MMSRAEAGQRAAERWDAGVERLRPVAGRFAAKSEDAKLYGAAVVVGIAGALGAIAFRLAIWTFQGLFYGPNLNPGSVLFPLLHVLNLFDALGPLGDARFILIPAVGALIVGLIIHVTSPEVRGHGVPKVLSAVLTRGGRIDPRIAVYKTLASSIAIASGGSLGREGPIVQIGSATGSAFGRFFQRKANTRVLVAAGAAAGIAGTFNAPLGGIAFAMEIILGAYALRNLIAVVLAATTSTMLVRIVLHFGSTPGVRGFLVPIPYQLVNPPVEVVLYAVLGVVMAVAATLAVKLLYGVEAGFERLRAPVWAKPVVGAVVLGLSVLLTAAVMGAPGRDGAGWLLGVGYDTIHDMLLGQATLALLIALAVMKAVGFTFSVGSGSSGGVFSPSLFIGAAVGGAFGTVANLLVPGIAGPGAYAIVGMGGMFAAAAAAPLTATLIIFELTGEYTIILPLLVACVLSSGIARVLLEGSTIYYEKLRLQKITVQNRRIGSIEDLTVGDVMTGNVTTVREEAPGSEALRVFRTTGRSVLPVVDARGAPVAMLSWRVLNQVLRYDPRALPPGGEDPDVAALLPAVRDLAVHEVHTVTTDTNLLAAVDRMQAVGTYRLVVVDTSGRLVGILTGRDVLRAYDALQFA